MKAQLVKSREAETKAKTEQALLRSEKEDLKNKLASEGDKMFGEFLQSPSLPHLAYTLAAPGMKSALYAFADRLSDFYPFTPEELGLSESTEAEEFNFSGYHFDRESKKLLTPNGSEITIPENILPTLEEMAVKHAWAKLTWPDEMKQLWEVRRRDSDEETAKDQGGDMAGGS